ncbi:stage II sporulation protein M [Candidatus Woesearchaeota archaeon]|nr:stage II sporulation protein M [Candidatus Woesearchaeota archaeon]MBW3016497.1 stage II sporulation protein M [Candidatus Woesearchaeota archaeon]
MVMEELYSAEFLHEHPWYGFLLGVGYTILGLFIAIMIFPKDPALIAIGITCLFLLPSLSKLTDSSEITKQRKPTFKQFLKDSIPHTKVYVAMFFGIFFTFAFFSIMLPSLAAGHLFKVQLAVLTGQAIKLSMPLFWDLFTWNLQVLGMCFLLSLIAGNGGIVFVAWNASVWGTVFGNLARTAATQATLNPIILFVLVILSVFPHTFLEGLSYMISAIAGTTLSDGIVKQKMLSKEMKTIAKYTMLLLLIGVGVLALGMLVETYTLGNADVYRKIINLAFPR